MTDPDALEALAERVEQASVGHRELDAEVMFDLYAKPIGQKDDGGPVGYIWPENNPSWNFGLRFPGSTRELILEARRRNSGETLIIERDGAPVLMNDIRIPHVTTSIDAALTLVPEDMRDEIEITTLYCVARVTINMNHGPDGSPFYGENKSNSIPLAICAAALKARALASQQRNDGAGG